MAKDIPLPHYSFSEKYDAEHARRYFDKHNTGVFRVLSNWREHAMARKALAMAGEPLSVLDLPCGTGRFWGLLAEKPGRTIHVADNSQEMIDVGLGMRPPEIRKRIVDAKCCSAFDTGFPNNYVDCVFCFRLMHHIEKSEDRISMLKEFARISSRSIIVSLWVDGNYRAYRHEAHRARKARNRETLQANRFVIRRQDIEADFSKAGLSVVGHVDFLKYWEKWRTYVLSVE